MKIEEIIISRECQLPTKMDYSQFLRSLVMTAAADPVKLMKQEVGKAAANLVKSGSIVGLGYRVNHSVYNTVFRRSPQVW
jgi:hypothetical protein